MSISEIKRTAKSTLHGNWEIALITLFMFVAIEIIAGLFTFGIGAIIVQGPLALGTFYIYYSVTEGRKPS